MNKFERAWLTYWQTNYGTLCEIAGCTRKAKLVKLPILRPIALKFAGYYIDQMEDIRL